MVTIVKKDENKEEEEVEEEEEQVLENQQNKLAENTSKSNENQTEQIKIVNAIPPKDNKEPVVNAITDENKNNNLPKSEQAGSKVNQKSITGIEDKKSIAVNSVDRDKKPLEEGTILQTNNTVVTIVKKDENNEDEELEEDEEQTKENNINTNEIALVNKKTNAANSDENVQEEEKEGTKKNNRLEEKLENDNVNDNKNKSSVQKTNTNIRLLPDNYVKFDKDLNGNISYDEIIKLIDSFFDDDPNVKGEDITSLIDYFFDN